MRIAVAGLAFVLLLLLAGLGTVAVLPMNPPMQKVEMALPDGRVPR